MRESRRIVSPAAPAGGAAASSQLAARRIARPIARIFGDHLAAAGLSESQYLLLTQLVSGPLRAIDLADRMEVQPSTLSRNLRPLLHAGLIESAPSADARSRPLRLTVRGARQHAQARRHYESAEQALRALLGNKRIAALHLLAGDIHRLLDRNAGHGAP